MKTNTIHRNILKVIGLYLNPEAKLSEKILSSMINSFIIIFMIIFSISTSIYNVIYNIDDIIEILLTFPQIVGHSSCLCPYLFMCGNKKRLFEIFYDIENIVNERETYSKHNYHFYDKTIKFTNKLIKYPIIICASSFTFNAFFAAFVDLVKDLSTGEIVIENWRTSYRYK